MTACSDHADPDTIRRSIDRQIRHWVADAPAQLAADARRPFEVVDNRLRGRFLIVATQALPGECDRETTVAAATSAELLFGQAWLNERAAGFVDDRPAETDRTRALLASDYLHATAYAGVSRLSVDPQLGQAWYQTLERASERLAEGWVRSTSECDSETSHHEPIEPVVTATAGRLAALLADTPEYRDALDATGAILGVARWTTKTGKPLSALPSEVLPDHLSAVEPARVNPVETIQDLLTPVPESDGLTALQSLAESIVGTGQTEIES